jgi:hypothetical protein
LALADAALAIGTAAFPAGGAAQPLEQPRVPARRHAK